MSTGYTAPSPAASPKDVEIVKPDTHRRDYAYLELENGVKVVVASDPECDKAGAAATMNVGMCHERKDLPGLAHFLEHMLFTGTKTYPIEKEYHEFISQNGGSANANTTCYFTNYMFEIKPEKLTEALDRFSKCFSESLLSKDCTEREVNAVDSEFQMGLTQPWWRFVGIMSMSANPEHPFHVACGNNKVLLEEPKTRGIDLHTEVVKLYNETYSANGLTVCIIGKESVAELKALAKEKFGSVVNKNITMPIGDDYCPAPAFLPADWHRLLLQCPVQDVKELEFTWVIPYQAPLWRTKPTAYVNHLLGHEGEGSVIAALKDMGLLSSCYPFDGAWLQGSFSLFSIHCDITDKGLEEIKTIGKYFFAYIQMLQKTSVEKWIWDEMKKLREMQFKLGEDMQPFDLAEAIAGELQKKAPSEVLAGGSLLYEYDPDGIRSILDLLKVGTMRVSYQSKTLEARCTDKDTSYESPMKFEDIPEEWLKEWGSDLDAAALGLALPKPNPFIPEDLSLRELPATPPKFPKRIENPPSPIACVLYRQDDVFKQPKASISINIRCPYVMESAKTQVMVDLWCACLKEELNVFAYDADVAGLSFGVSRSSGSSLELGVGGFNDKLGILLTTVTEKMRSLTSLPENIYEIVHDQHRDNLNNAAFHTAPYGQVSQRFGNLTDRGSKFPLIDQWEAFKTITREDFEGLPAKLFAAGHVEIMALGNTNAADASRLAEICAKGLQISKVLDTIPERKEAKFLPGCTVWDLESADKDDPNNCVKMWTQLELTDENKVLASLFNSVLSTKFFDTLRTQQQLGYVCGTGPNVTSSFVYWVAIIQTEYPVDYARSRIDDFLIEHYKWIEESLDDTEFQTCREGLLAELKTKPKNLGEEAGRWSRGFSDRTYDFGSLDRRVAFLEKNVTLETLRKFVREQIVPASKLYVQISKVVDKPNKELPEGKVTPPDPPAVTKWSGHDGVVEAFEKSTPGWVSWKGSSPDAWKVASV